MKKTKPQVLRAAEKLKIKVLECQSIDAPMPGFVDGRTLVLALEFPGETTGMYICPEKTPRRAPVSYFVQALRQASKDAREQAINPTPGGVIIQTAAHDDDCPFIKDDGPCSCEIEYSNKLWRPPH